MFSKTDICNMALGNIAHTEFIADIEMETTPAARACKRYYKQNVYSMLESFDWSFARKREDLAILDGEVSKEYKFVYAMPNDCLKPRRIDQVRFCGEYMVPVNQLISFEVGLSSDGKTRAIFTDEPNAVLVYTTSETNEYVFTANFTAALSWLLGASLATALGKGVKTKQDCLNIYGEVLIAAQGTDASSEQVPSRIQSESVNARLS